MALPNDTATRIVRAIIAEKRIYETANPGKQYTLGPAADVARRLLQDEADAGTLPKKRKAKPAKKPETETDEAWIQSLEAKEVYGHVDIRRELGKAQTWGENTKPVTKITRRHFINWINKIPVPIGYSGKGKSSNDSKTQKTTAPKGWLAVLREMYPTSVYFQPGGQFEIKTESDSAWSQIPASVRLAIEKEIEK